MYYNQPWKYCYQMEINFNVFFIPKTYMQSWIESISNNDSTINASQIKASRENQGGFELTSFLFFHG